MHSSPFDHVFEKSTPLAPIIIAELGAKYGGLQTVKDMVSAAATCQVDAVKFQTFRAHTITTEGSLFTMEDGSKVSQYDFFKRYELDENDHVELIGQCQSLGLPWLSTPSHASDVELLERFDPCAYKTGSDDLTNLPFLRLLAKTGRTMLVSTGMSTLGEVERAVETISKEGNSKIILLHCVVSYPSRPEDANLKVIETLRKAFALPVGLSDHTTDELTSVIATALGASVIEKHLTLDHSLKLPDHEASLDPDQFSRLVRQVRLANKALGSGVKDICETERKWREAARKSLFADRDIAAGEVISEGDIAIRRPSSGLSPYMLDIVVGRTARAAIKAGQLISWDMF